MKLIAIDMDGTLLSNNKELSQANIQAIEDAVAQDHIVMICSGRSHDDILLFLKDNNLSLPLAGSNGAVVYTDSRVIHSTAMDFQAAIEAFKHLDAQEHPFKVYTNKGIFSQDNFLERAIKEFSNAPEKLEADGLNIEHLIEFQKKSPSNPFTSFEELEAITGLEVYKFFVFTPDKGKKETLISSIEPIEGIALTSSGANNIEVMGINGHKGNGLNQMAKYYHIPKEDTVAIGDNFNDVPMLQAAGLSIAMGNAEDDVKKLCDVVTLTNEEDGVAYAIRKYILNEDV